jgi:hypothetical protein
MSRTFHSLFKVLFIFRRFCCPVRTEPRLSLVTSSVRTQLRGNRERLVIVGTCRFERFYGSFRPGKNTAFEYTSILVRPRQETRIRAFWWSRRVPPPGPLHLFRDIIYHHSRAPVAAASLPGARCSSTTRCACRSCCLHSPLGFLHPSGSKRSTALAAFCPEPSARNGFLLARNSCRLSAASIPGSKLPACYFASLPDNFTARSALRLHYRQSGLRRLRPLHCLGPVALPLPGLACRSCYLHSPPGLLHPSGSKRSTALAACRST